MLRLRGNFALLENVMIGARSYCFSCDVQTVLQFRKLCDDNKWLFTKGGKEFLLHWFHCLLS